MRNIRCIVLDMEYRRSLRFNKRTLALVVALYLAHPLFVGAQIFNGSCPGGVGLTSPCGVTSTGSELTNVAASTSTSSYGTAIGSGTGVGATTGTTVNSPTGSSASLPGSTNSSSSTPGSTSISNLPATGNFGGSITGQPGTTIAPGVNNTAGLPGGGIVNQPGLSLPPTGQSSNSTLNSTGSSSGNTNTMIGGSTIVGSPPLPIDNLNQNLPGGAPLGQSAGIVGGSIISPDTGLAPSTTGQAAGTAGGSSTP